MIPIFSPILEIIPSPIGSLLLQNEAAWQWGCHFSGISAVRPKLAQFKASLSLSPAVSASWVSWQDFLSEPPRCQKKGKGRERRGRKEGWTRSLPTWFPEQKPRCPPWDNLSKKRQSKTGSVPPQTNDANDFPVILGAAAVFTSCPKQKWVTVFLIDRDTECPVACNREWGAYTKNRVPEDSQRLCNSSK